LEKVKRRGTDIIARGPACAEAGGDRKGEHLFINDKGQFGCVLYPGEDGHAHRQRIFELAGVKNMPGRKFEVRKPLSSPPEPMDIQKDIFGTLGTHTFNTRPKELNDPIKRINNNIQENSNETVPSVPEPEMERQSKVIFTPEEERLLAEIDAESLEKVRMIKDIFNGTVVDVEDNVCETGVTGGQNPNDLGISERVKMKNDYILPFVARRKS
jgi:hypothetical protein